jgi:hypothetical protein
VERDGQVLGAQQRAKSTKIHPRWRLVKFTTILLPFLCFAVERRVKNKFRLPAFNRKAFYPKISAPQGKCASDGP